MFKVIEKDNPLAVHSLHGTKASAERWIEQQAPEYCRKGFFMNKSLTPESFAIVESSSKR